MSLLDRRIALLLLAAYAVFATLGLGWTVCRGADGHVAVESLAAACCAGDDECGDCDDTPFADAVTAREVEAPPDVPVPTDTVAIVVAAARPVCTAWAPGAPAPTVVRDRPPDATLALLRTVVLRR